MDGCDSRVDDEGNEEGRKGEESDEARSSSPITNDPTTTHRHLGLRLHAHLARILHRQFVLAKTPKTRSRNNNSKLALRHIPAAPR